MYAEITIVASFYFSAIVRTSSQKNNVYCSIEKVNELCTILLWFSPVGDVWHFWVNQNDAVYWLLLLMLMFVFDLRLFRVLDR